MDNVRSKIQKKILFIFILIIFSQNLLAQFFSDDVCGTNSKLNLSIKNMPWYGNNDFLSGYLNDIGYDENSVNVIYRIPVKFWVYRLSDGSKGVSNFYLKKQIKYLNYFHSKNNTGIRFYQHPEVTYIDKDRLYVLKYMTTGISQNFMHKEKGCINILLAGNLIKNIPGNVPKEYHGTHNSVTHNIIIRQDIATQTLTHEIGHFLGLEHPHRNWKKGKRKQEAVDRTRELHGLFRNGLVCELNGDKLCDTPAEPDLSKYTNDRCKYTGWNVKDNWEEVYKPHTNNIMSYCKNRECRTHFTKGQIAVMLYTAEKYRYSDDWRVNKENKKYSFDYQEPNDSKEAATRILFNTVQPNTFHKIFTKSKRNVPSDKNDWFFFDINSKKAHDIEIVIDKTNLPFPQKLKVYIYKDSKIISEVSDFKKSKKTISLKKVSKGRYFIRAENNNSSSELTGYSLLVSADIEALENDTGKDKGK